MFDPYFFYKRQIFTSTKSYMTAYTVFSKKKVMYLFDLTKINCSIYLIIKSLYHIIEMCKIKYFICDRVANKIFNLTHLYYIVMILKVLEYFTALSFVPKNFTKYCLCKRFK